MILIIRDILVQRAVHDTTSQDFRDYRTASHFFYPCDKNDTISYTALDFHFPVSKKNQQTAHSPRCRPEYAEEDVSGKSDV